MKLYNPFESDNLWIILSSLIIINLVLLSIFMLTLVKTPIILSIIGFALLLYML